MCALGQIIQFRPDTHGIRPPLSDEPNPSDLMRPFPAEPMRMCPISTRVKKPENDDPSVIEPVELSAATALRNR